MSFAQLPLKLHLRDDSIFDNYVVGENQQLLFHLKQLSRHPLNHFVYCYGESGSGRSHLLQACCHEVNLQKRSAFYLPLQHHQQFKTAILEDLEQFDLVCIDDIDAVIKNRSWEEALFHCYNRLRDKQTPLIISALIPPQQLSCYLPDLQTRLSSGLVLKIQALSDEDKKITLQLRAANRGIHLTEDVIHYMLRHYSRSMSELFALLDTLDRASLVAKRKITIPFVKSVVGV